MNEKWKDIPDYEDYYQVSNYGNVRTKERIIKNVNGKDTLYRSKERKASISEYRLIALSKKGFVKMFKISRLVAKLFVDGRNETRKIVNHIDGNKHNDFYKNLEWCTYSENAIHSSNMYKKDGKNIGVFFDKKRNKWTSYLYRESKNLFIGRFTTEKEALEAKNKYEIEWLKNQN